MNEKILTIIYRKICDGFNANFIPRNEFETEVSKISPSVLEKLNGITKKHRQLKYSKLKKENSQLIKISKNDYILDCFNSSYNRTYHYSFTTNKYTKDDLADLQTSKQNDFNSYSDKYNECYENETNGIIISLLEFVENELQNSADELKSNAVENDFWDFFNDNYLQKDWNDSYSSSKANEVLNSPETILKKFTDKYLDNKFIKLLDRAEKNLKDEDISGFDQIIINVGTRSYETGRSGWTTNSFTVFNNKNEYNFTTSTKDEKLIEGEFVNIFIFQKKYLIKLSISLKEVERVPYIIYRDCEKIALKNESEIVIVKHHGNETIVFDNRKEALSFQIKLIEIRQGMGRQK